MALTWTAEDFETLSWHDDTVYGVRLAVADPQAGDWRSDLILEIDHIVEWIGASEQEQRINFRIAPAHLTFHDTTDLDLRLNWGDSGSQTNLSEASIDRIERARVQDQKICLDRPFYRWAIEMNWPHGGRIAFGASGFTLTLLADPVLSDQQALSPAERAKRLSSA